MIVGSGDISSILPNKENLLFFASGVSNSKEKDEMAYQREIDLLFDQNRASHIVYFSTLAIFYSDTRYTRHKLDMEAMVKENFSEYCIIRLGNIDWGTNPHTLINYLREHPKAELKDEYRYICTKDELLHWVNLIPDFNVEFNITGERLTIKEIYDKYARVS